MATLTALSRTYLLDLEKFDFDLFASWEIADGPRDHPEQILLRALKSHPGVAAVGLDLEARYITIELRPEADNAIVRQEISDLAEKQMKLYRQAGKAPSVGDMLAGLFRSKKAA